jgi:thiamine-monophosphate kinase
MVEWLRRQAPLIGDDCAVIPNGPADLLLKVDMLVENVHFRRAERSAADVGYRALARALSDMAAMGGTPKYALVALALAPWTTRRWVEGFYRGFLGLAKQHRVELAGGDLSHADQLVADVFLTGTAPRGKALRRHGARPGDTIYVSGPLGRRAWCFQPRLALGRRLRQDKAVTACMDISDGIALDLHRLMAASGVAAELHRVPLARGASEQRALHYGEDYELLFTRRIPFGKPPDGVIAVGKIVNGKRGSVTLRGETVPPVGYDHWKQL